jgi:peptide/nickel transport system substrate-binding protein
MDSSRYWSEVAKRRFSRRRLLKGAAGLGAGLAALTVVGCGDGEKEATVKPTGEAVRTATAVGTATPTGTAVPYRSTLEPVKEGCRGGFLRYFGWDALTLDTFDPHQAQLGPIFNMHGAVFSKVLKYDDTLDQSMSSDLAENIPETPDKLTYVVKIRPNVRFHDTEKIRKNFPQVAGRQLTAEDVKYSIERQMNEASPRAALYYRSYQWQTVDKVEVLDPLTVRITTKRPMAPFLHFLADTNNFVIAKELVDPAKDDMNSIDKMIGTGPFMLDRFVSLQAVRTVRNPDWFAKDDFADIGLPDRPILDGYEATWMTQDDTAIEIAFKSKQVDVSDYVDQRNVDRVAREAGAVVAEVPSTGWVNSRLLINDSPGAVSPFKDLRLRLALSIAVDRNRMAQQIFQTAGLVVGPVHPGIKNWALPAEELAKKPGYRFTPQEREADLVEAKQMWEAAGGSQIGTVEVVYTAIPDYVKNNWPQLQRQLKEVLGLETTGHLDATGYTEIAQGLLQKRIVFCFGYDNGLIDLDDWLYPYFHSQGVKNSFMLADAELDRLLDAQRAEFDFQRRQQLGYEIQHYLLDKVAARLDWVAFIVRSTMWPYRRNHKHEPWMGLTYLWANEWLDRTHSTYQGRPD